MSLTFKINQAEVNTQIAEIVRVTGRSAGDVVTQEGKLLVQDVVKQTPPFSSAPSSESFNVQRRAGEAAVERQISRFFTVVDPAKVRNPKTRKDLEQAIRRRNFEKIKFILKGLGFKHVQDVMAEASEELHRKNRDRRGRIQQGKRRFFVTREASVKRFIRTKRGHVGKAKAGWRRAAEALGVKLPGWITRHNSPGEFVDKRKDPKQPMITIGNLVQFIQGTGAELQIIQKAMKNRARNMRAKLEKIAKSGWTKKP